MTSKQIDLIIRLIKTRANIAAHPQTPPKDWLEYAEELEDRLRATAIVCPVCDGAGVMGSCACTPVEMKGDA